MAKGNSSKNKKSYNTFGDNESVKKLLGTSDRIQDAERSIAASESAAAQVLVGLEAQRSQLTNAHGLVKETTGFTISTQKELKKIAENAARKKNYLYLIIASLIVLNLWVFYELFLNRRRQDKIFTMKGMWVAYLKPVLKYFMEDLIGGPRPIQQRQVINMQKGSTFLVMLSLQYYYNNWSFPACIYTALHGSYGIIWILKDIIIPDPGWNVFITFPSALVIAIVLAGYWSAGYIIITSSNFTVSPVRALAAIMSHTIGAVLMMGSDTQKYFTLKLKKGLISDGFVSRCRNTNYLGEVMIYGSYALLAQHWVPWAIYCSIWFTLFTSNMLTKDVSLRKKAGGKAYFEKSGLFFPNIYSWLRDKLRSKRKD